jgi:hypothetical protein
MEKQYTSLHEKEINCLVNNLKKAPKGIVICAGTWRGGDLMAMIRECQDRYYIVIDSFKGLDTPNDNDYNKNTVAKKGMFNIQGKDNYIKNFKEQNIRIPDEIQEMWITEETIKTIEVSQIAFIWLDLDHYIPTKACLDYFKNKTVKDCIILVHDYSLSVTPGVKKACCEVYKEWTHQTGGIFKGKN